MTQKFATSFERVGSGSYVRRQHANYDICELKSRKQSDARQYCSYEVSPREPHSEKSWIFDRNSSSPAFKASNAKKYIQMEAFRNKRESWRKNDVISWFTNTGEQPSCRVYIF